MRSLLVLLVLVQTSFAFGQDDAKRFASLNRAELALSATLQKVEFGPAALSDPPIYSMTLHLANAQLMRGQGPVPATLAYSSTQKLQDGMPVLIAARRLDNNRVVASAVLPATNENVAIALKAVRVPLGWSLDKGEVVSPWAGLGKYDKWPAVKTAEMCSKSGRPSLTVPAGIVIDVKQIAPVKPIQFKNPFGDGQFKITVHNSTAQELVIPALLTDGQNISWGDSLTVLIDDKAYILPTAGKAPRALQPMTLRGGDTVMTTVNTLEFKGVSWPRGGSRVYMQFCLGDMSRTSFFYYFSSLHDGMIPR